MPGTIQNASGSNVQLAHTLYGDLVGGGQGINDSNPNVQLATGYSTAPYKPPKRREKDAPTKTLCAFEGGCKAFPMKTVPYCTGHARSLGLVDFSKKKKEDQPDVDDC